MPGLHCRVVGPVQPVCGVRWGRVREESGFTGMSGKEYEQVGKEESVELSTEGKEGEEGGCCGSCVTEPALVDGCSW